MPALSIGARVLVAGFLVGLFATASVVAQGDELREASELAKLGQYERALAQVDAYLKDRPKDARGRFLKGLILAEQKKSDDAIAIFTELTRDYPELPEPYNNLAVLYANRGEYDKARSALEMAIRTHPSYATAHENLGDVYAKMASQAYDKALQFDRGNRTAQTKLNLIRELFSNAPAPKAATGQVAKAEEAPSKPPAKAAAPKPAGPIVSAAPAIAAGAGPATDSARKKPAGEPAGPDKIAAKAPPRENARSVLQAVDQWAKAWSDNDVATYLTHYAADFEPPEGMSRADWEAQRKARIAKPRKIEVAIEAPKVVFAGEDRVKVTFRQRYRSDTFNAIGMKTLDMIRQGDKWLITREQFGG
jgi:tetratricopeptide (TPR) repeat protein